MPYLKRILQQLFQSLKYKVGALRKGHCEIERNSVGRQAVGVLQIINALIFLLNIYFLFT